MYDRLDINNNRNYTIHNSICGFNGGLVMLIIWLGIAILIVWDLILFIGEIQHELKEGEED